MKNLTVLIKPASGLCNMRCEYCFYRPLAGGRECAPAGVMADAVTAELIKKALGECDAVSFAFQGGEPTLAGLDYFRRFVEEVKRQGGKDARAEYSIQTNGLDVSQEMAQFFLENDFLIGVSLDGPQNIHDRMRRDAAGGGTFRRVMETIRLFDRMKARYNILCVVTADTARHLGRVYRFFREQGFQYLQFIPCLGPLDAPPFAQPYALTPQRYCRYMTRLFDLWADDVEAGRGVSIRFFDNLLQVAAGYPPELCGMHGRCPGQFVVESDGSLFPCDFYCTDGWRVGSIAQMTFAEAYASPAMQRFIESSALRGEDCARCEYFALCLGGCRRDRDASSCGAAGENVYCEALKEFYCHAAPRLPALLRSLGVPPGR